LSRIERRSEALHGIRINYAAAYWTPPMTPRLAFDLERTQIESLNLNAMVSITDHDNINAPMLLRTIPSARQIPVSLEWSAPTASSLSTLASTTCPAPMRRMGGYPRGLYGQPREGRLTEILSALNAEPNVLVIFNHPMWDSTSSGKRGTGSW